MPRSASHGPSPACAVPDARACGARRAADWLCFDVVFRRAIYKIKHIPTCIVWCLLLLLPPWAYYVPAAATDPDWYAEHEWASTETPTDVGVVLLKFHPACYVHVFLFGMILARLRKLVAEAIEKANKRATAGAREGDMTHGWGPRAVERFLRFGVCIGYFFLLLVFTCEPLKPASWKLSARLSVLQAAQGMLIIGLAPVKAAEVAKSGLAVDRLFDPIGFVLSFSPASWGHLSYGQYILQFICIALWPATMLQQPYELLLFMVFLLGWAYFAANMITMPAAKWWNKRSPCPARRFEPSTRRISPSRVCGSHAVRPPRPDSIQLFFCCATVGAIGAIMCGSDVYEREYLTSKPLSGCEQYDGSYVHLLPDPYLRVPVMHTSEGGWVEDAIDVKLNWTAGSCGLTQDAEATCLSDR